MSQKDISEINIIYDIKGKNEIKIFGSEFVKNNKNKCKMIINNKEYEITKEYKVKTNKNNKLQIKLKGINNITNMSYMFYGCSSLISEREPIHFISKNHSNYIYCIAILNSVNNNRLISGGYDSKIIVYDKNYTHPENK